MEKLTIKNKGFSLIELIVAMSIVSIIITISFPSYKSSNISNRLSGETNQLTNILSFARNEALRRNNFVSICASTNNTSCNSKDFNNGAIVFTNETKSTTINSANILRKIGKWQGTDSGQMNLDDSESSMLTFNGAGAPISKGNILICSKGYNSYNVNINNIGGINIIKNVGDNGCS